MLQSSTLGWAKFGGWRGRGGLHQAAKGVQQLYPLERAAHQLPDTFLKQTQLLSTLVKRLQAWGASWAAAASPLGGSSTPAGGVISLQLSVTGLFIPCRPWGSLDGGAVQTKLSQVRQLQPGFSSMNLSHRQCTSRWQHVQVSVQVRTAASLLSNAGKVAKDRCRPGGLIRASSV
jgi:hypothetical protein